MVWCLHKSYSKIFDTIRNYLRVCAGKCNSVRLWWSASLPPHAWFAKAPKSIDVHLALIVNAIWPSPYTISSIHNNLPGMGGWNWVSSRWNLFFLLTPVLFSWAGCSMEVFHPRDQTQTNKLRAMKATMNKKSLRRIQQTYSAYPGLHQRMCCKQHRLRCRATTHHICYIRRGIGKWHGGILNDSRIWQQHITNILLVSSEFCGYHTASSNTWHLQDC